MMTPSGRKVTQVEERKKKKILESLANPKISFGFAVVFHFE
jgi:hypothetical protein